MSWAISSLAPCQRTTSGCIAVLKRMDESLRATLFTIISIPRICSPIIDVVYPTEKYTRYGLVYALIISMIGISLSSVCLCVAGNVLR